MNKIVKVKDDLGTGYIVVSKIRELHLSFGELSITYDNGDKRVLSAQDPESTLKDIIVAIESQT
ncbi:MAG: hypothetical protein RBR69_04550 [Candidatus Cloacimonadaceae bacterium]|jgi:hypothetical protein|nr:hypothetical protein [Candidatus Cloacimonadota bacterium]MDY0127379.1 hypothetical protein [Candidatus Cloacimonadaceae bacterium]MCB5254737.1 hypothetical protein [Candidatus Cloacimonadota bacterium]MCK9178227.1 hypothetical protein [Candidatus Cloacimonadota bacterium]MCK9241730.1 hypothetical protein [Candidatus Cloacimonadota bacterium]